MKKTLYFVSMVVIAGITADAQDEKKPAIKVSVVASVKADDGQDLERKQGIYKDAFNEALTSTFTPTTEYRTEAGTGVVSVLRDLDSGQIAVLIAHGTHNNDFGLNDGSSATAKDVQESNYRFSNTKVLFLESCWCGEDGSLANAFFDRGVKIAISPGDAAATDLDMIPFFAKFSADLAAGKSIDEAFEDAAKTTTSPKDKEKKTTPFWDTAKNAPKGVRLHTAPGVDPKKPFNVATGEQAAKNQEQKKDDKSQDNKKDDPKPSPKSENRAPSHLPVVQPPQKVCSSGGGLVGAVNAITCQMQ